MNTSKLISSEPSSVSSSPDESVAAAARVRMDPELKAKWVAALRSGKYEQATGQLRRGATSFCCLGVLCDVSPEIEWNRESAVYGADQGDDAESDDSELPYGFAKALGLVAVEHTLINMNDGNEEKNIRRHSFSEIADYIEANL